MGGIIDLGGIIALLKEFAHQKRSRLQVILTCGLAAQYYGMKDRATVDIHAEVKGDVEGLIGFLKAKGIPADIGEDISGWSVVAMPPGYRERAVEVYRDELLIVKVLDPIDFIIAKLRRTTEEDIQDALFVAEKLNLTPEAVKGRAEVAIKNSPKDTALFVFRKNVDTFVELLRDKGR